MCIGLHYNVFTIYAVVPGSVPYLLQITLFGRTFREQFTVVTIVDLGVYLVSSTGENSPSIMETLMPLSHYYTMRLESFLTCRNKWACFPLTNIGNYTSMFYCSGWQPLVLIPIFRLRFVKIWMMASCLLLKKNCIMLSGCAKCFTWWIGVPILLFPFCRWKTWEGMSSSAEDLNQTSPDLHLSHWASTLHKCAISVDVCQENAGDSPFPFIVNSSLVHLNVCRCWHRCLLCW